MRAVLALALLAGYFVLGFGLALGLAAMSLYAMLEGRLYAAVWIGVFALALGGPLALATYRALVKRPDPGGLPLPRAEQPELWRHVDELAAAVGTRGPDEIRLLPGVEAAVWEHKDHRYLMIGLPMLAGLTVTELRSVLAHELGHYAEGHSRAEAYAFRARIALDGSVHHLREAGVGSLVYLYAKLYGLASASISRDRERFADELAVRAAGSEPSQAAIRRAGPLQLAWEEFADSYLTLAHLAGRRPPVVEGFHAFLSHPMRAKRLRDLELQLMRDEPVSRFDSHPPVWQRVAAMAQASGPAVVPDERVAAVLVEDVERLGHELLLREEFPLGDWSEVVQLAGPGHVAARAGALAHAARVSGIGNTLDDVLAALERGELRRLTGVTIERHVSDEEANRAAAEAVGELLAFAIADACVRSGFPLAHDWSGVTTVALRDHVYDTGFWAVDAAASPMHASAQRKHLAAMGVNLL